jgi:dipeptidyl aminopeptidase/acylaminoacyl peptidase
MPADVPYWLLDHLLRESGFESRNPDGTGLSIEHGTKWGHSVAVGRKARSISMLPGVWRSMADRVRKIADDSFKEGHAVTSKENYFLASMYYCRAQWSIWEHTEELEELHRMKNECYEKVIELNHYPIERVEIPFEDGDLPGLLHLPNANGRFPLMVLVPGMDQTKEESVNIVTSEYTKRGLAVLTVDGPGQGESLGVRKINVKQDSFDRAGRAIYEKISRHRSIIKGKVAVFGNSMGSYWAPRMAAKTPEYAACVAALACVEPGMKTKVRRSYPSCRLRYMFMAGIKDDYAFDEYTTRMSLNDVDTLIRRPFLFVTGKYDQLCPVRYVRRLYDRMTAPRQFYVYDGEFHPMGKVAGEVYDLVSDWVHDRLAGKPMKRGWHEVPAL